MSCQQLLKMLETEYRSLSSNLLFLDRFVSAQVAELSPATALIEIKSIRFTPACLQFELPQILRNSFQLLLIPVIQLIYLSSLECMHLFAEQSLS